MTSVDVRTFAREPWEILAEIEQALEDVRIAINQLLAWHQSKELDIPEAEYLEWSEETYGALLVVAHDVGVERNQEGAIKAMDRAFGWARRGEWQLAAEGLAQANEQLEGIIDDIDELDAEIKGEVAITGRAKSLQEFLRSERTRKVVKLLAETSQQLEPLIERVHALADPQWPLQVRHYRAY